MSDIFRGFHQLRFHYLQLKAAFALKGDKSSAFLHEYKDYVLSLYLQKHCDAATLKLFCNQAIKNLNEYDQSHGTQYFQTLYCFLKNERSLKQSASELNIHRNTLLNRLEKINALTDLELDDHAVRMWLLFSFEILKNI